jgi:hypothetical protein
MPPFSGVCTCLLEACHAGYSSFFNILYATVTTYVTVVKSMAPTLVTFNVSCILLAAVIRIPSIRIYDIHYHYTLFYSFLQNYTRYHTTSRCSYTKYVGHVPQLSCCIGIWNMSCPCFHYFRVHFVIRVCPHCFKTGLLYSCLQRNDLSLGPALFPGPALSPLYN